MISEGSMKFGRLGAMTVEALDAIQIIVTRMSDVSEGLMVKYPEGPESMGQEDAAANEALQAVVILGGVAISLAVKHTKPGEGSGQVIALCGIMVYEAAKLLARRGIPVPRNTATEYFLGVDDSPEMTAHYRAASESIAKQSAEASPSPPLDNNFYRPMAKR